MPAIISLKCEESHKARSSRDNFQWPINIPSLSDVVYSSQAMKCLFIV